MKYQVIEKEIYSEAYLLHFGEIIEDYGDLINSSLPDYAGIQLGMAMLETEDKHEAIQFKNKLEIKRLKTLRGAVNAFFHNDNVAKEFYHSINFSQLQEFYQQAFELVLVRKGANEMIIENDEFYFPAHASDEQILAIQKLLSFYFFKIIEKE